jgi:hypothetical protein
MFRMITQMRDRMKARVGIYGTGWNPESTMGLVLPFLLAALLIFIGWLFVASLS